MTGAERQPAQFWRVALAFAVAPIPSILVFSLLENGFQGFERGTYLIAILGAYPPLILLGVPLYLLLHREVRPTLTLTCILAGVVAVLPWLLLVSLQLLAKIFAMGVLAGVVFWMIASRRVQPD